MAKNYLDLTGLSSVLTSVKENIDSQIESVSSGYTTADSALDEKITSETTTRQQEDAKLQGNLDTSKAELQGNIDKKQDKFTVGDGLELKEGVLNITLDTSLYKVVSTLPEEDQDSKKIYLVPATSNKTGKNNYTEYIWTGEEWESLGTLDASVNMSDYAKKSETVSLETYTTDKETFATKTELGLKLDSATYNVDKPTFATKEDLTEKVDVSVYTTEKANFATKSEVGAKLNTSTYATDKAIIETSIEEKLDISVYNTDKPTFLSKDDFVAITEEEITELVSSIFSN